MRVINRTRRVLLFLLFTVLLTGTSSALLDGTSSHYDGFTIFDGTLSNNGEYARVLIEFAVYDNREGQSGGSEFESVFSSMGLTPPDAENFGDYIYAYKLYNHPDSESMISYFGLLGIDEQENGITDLGTYDDGAGGAQPSDYYFSDSDCVWEWSGLGEEGDSPLRFIDLGDNSWLLVYSSSYDWVKGDYELRGAEESDVPVPPKVPEPAVVVLLGAGGAYLLRKRRTSSTVS
jgi:hypothetical protein